jgi:hypothetical protein
VTAEQPGALLPGREPHSLVVHVVVDTIVAFLLLVIVLFILGVSIEVIAGVSVVLGLVAGPFTRRAEIRQLAERMSDTPSDSG